MGRLRKRQRRGTDHLTDGTPAGATPTLAPTYVTVRAEVERAEPAYAALAAQSQPSVTEPEVIAPVLPLEGLDPWAEIVGPALALEDAPADVDAGFTFSHPDQLELEPWSLARDAAMAEAQEFEEEQPPVADEPDAPEPEPAVESAANPAPETAEPAFAAPPPPPPDPAELLYADARAAAEEGRVTDALRLYRELVAQYPRHLRARNNLALLLDAAGDHQGALAELDRALELDPEHTTLLTNRGALLGALGRYAAAERDLRRVLRVEPANVEALFNLGVVMTKKGLWGEAVPHLRHVTELAADRGAAFYYLGEALNHVDDLLGALAAFQRATELQPGNARALYGLGIIYDRLARPDDAALMYRKSREVARR
jgi:tetratricopeptide (TPR) repeat protein